MHTDTRKIQNQVSSSFNHAPQGLALCIGSLEPNAEVKCKHGMVFSWNNAVVAARSYLPGTRDLTYGTMAALLRGIWETTTLHSSCELEMEVHIRGRDHTHYRALFLTEGSSKIE